MGHEIRLRPAFTIPLILGTRQNTGQLLALAALSTVEIIAVGTGYEEDESKGLFKRSSGIKIITAQSHFTAHRLN
jgi:hypothetical protein